MEQKVEATQSGDFPKRTKHKHIFQKKDRQKKVQRSTPTLPFQGLRQKTSCRVVKLEKQYVAASNHQCFGLCKDVQFTKVSNEQTNVRDQGRTFALEAATPKLSQTFIYLVYFQRVFYVKLNLM